MLKVYQSVNSSIKQLHGYIGNMVLNDWVNFGNGSVFNKQTLGPVLEEFYDSYTWFRNSLDKIYQLLPTLTNAQRNKIKQVYLNNNDISNLCSGQLQPLKMDDLPQALTKEITDLFEQLYTKMLNAARYTRDHDGTKVYYDLFYQTNQNHTCPFCGYHNMKSDLDKGREAYDHYLPKSKYPFAAVNFENLVPMCYECNSSYKGATDPLDNGSVAFYPFHNANYDIDVKIQHPQPVEWSNIDEGKCTVTIDTPNQNELATWERVFDVKKRYVQRIEQFDKQWIDELMNRCKLNLRRGITVEETLQDEIDLLDENEPLYNMTFLKKAFYNEVLKDDVYLETISDMLQEA